MKMNAPDRRCWSYPGPSLVSIAVLAVGAASGAAVHGGPESFAH